MTVIVTKGQRHCGFCKSVAEMVEDSEKLRRYECPNCKATERIFKGQTWWYFGWKHPDGSKLRAPTSEEMFAGQFGWQPETR